MIIGKVAIVASVIGIPTQPIKPNVQMRPIRTKPNEITRRRTGKTTNNTTIINTTDKDNITVIVVITSP